jgi:hypothetical protein
VRPFGVAELGVRLINELGVRLIKILEVTPTLKFAINAFSGLIVFSVF